MKPINKDEMFEHLSQFLQAKGIEMKDGSYTQRIRKGCDLLAGAINLGQKGFKRAKEGVDAGLEQMRQVIHEKTAPSASSRAAGAKAGVRSRPSSAKRKTPKAKRGKK